MSNVTVKLNYSKISNLKQKGIKGLFKLGYKQVLCVIVLELKKLTTQLLK